jgi:CRISPR/Cas system-associated exonuclease Cas4 (RecB family)
MKFKTDYGFEVQCEYCGKSKKIYLLNDKSEQAADKRITSFGWFIHENEEHSCSEECKLELDEFNKQIEESLNTIVDGKPLKEYEFNEINN